MWFLAKKEWSRVASLIRADPIYTSTFRLQCSNRVNCLEILEMGSGNSKCQGPGVGIFLNSKRLFKLYQEVTVARTVTRTGLSNENKHKQCYDYGCSLTDKCNVTHRS